MIGPASDAKIMAIATRQKYSQHKQSLYDSFVNDELQRSFTHRLEGLPGLEVGHAAELDAVDRADLVADGDLAVASGFTG